MTASTIYLGAVYLKDQEAANCAVGACGAGGGDARDAYNVAIKEINDAGGIAGRKVVPVYAPIDVNSTTPVSEQEQAACSTWTEDNEVFAILAASPVIEECAKQAGAAELYSNLAGVGSVPETFQRYPHFVDVVGMNLVRVGQVTVDGLAKQGYFGNNPKIGLITWSYPEYREGLQRGYISALRRHGLEPAVDPVYLTPPQTLNDLGQTSAEVNSAVLTFSSAGVDHVMLLDGRAGLCGVGCMGLEFFNRAKSQQYYPRYGLNDNNAPAAALKAGFYPPDQLRRSISVGWTDLDKSFDEGWHVNAMRERCYRLMRKYGVFLGSVNAQGNALEACDELWFIRDAVGRMGGAPLTVEGLVAAIETFGYDYPSTSAYGTHLTAAQHDGAGAVRIMKFADSCTCYRYVTDPYRV